MRTALMTGALPEAVRRFIREQIVVVPYDARRRANLTRNTRRSKPAARRRPTTRLNWQFIAEKPQTITAIALAVAEHLL